LKSCRQPFHLILLDPHIVVRKLLLVGCGTSSDRTLIGVWWFHHHLACLAGVGLM